MNDETLPEFNEIWQQTLGWQPDQQQQQKWQRLYQEILAANRQINLTRITDPNEFWEKHLWDSLAGVIGIDLVDPNNLSQIIDIGTGAGFPGIPVAIAFPNWQITLLDSTRKKINFIDCLLPTLELKNCQTLNGRSEEIGQTKCYIDAYNIALIRAVGEPSICAEYALPLLKTGGIAILYRGHWQEEETLKLELALKQLGGKIALIKTLQTPLSQSVRNFIYVQKIVKTPPQFPRGVGIPKQYPL
jgi:16S rRNA (guanine527-N7)-methyltransferase